MLSLHHILTAAALLVVAVPALAASVRVTASEAGVRLDPDPHSPIVTTVKAGTILELKTRGAEWYGVLLPPDAQGLQRFGYILASLVETFEDATAQRVQDRQPPGPPQRPPVQPEVLPLQPELTRRAKEGPYIGFRYWQNQYRTDGDFDGLHFVRSSDEMFVVPRLEAAGGPDIIFGYRYSRGAIELKYLRSTHRGSWLGLEGTAVYHAVDIDGKYHLLSNTPVQPYLLGGIGLSWLRVKDGVVPFSLRGSTGDATLTGFGTNGGGGVAVYPHPRVGVSGGVVYHVDFFTRGKGGATDWSNIDEAFLGRAIRISGGMTFTF